MLYIAVGTDFEKRKQYTDQLLSTMQKKRPGAEVFIFDSDNFSPDQCDYYLSSLGLFDDKSIIKISSICDIPEHKEYLLSHITEMVDSENAFVVSENKLQKTDIVKIEKLGVPIQDFSKKKTTEYYNIFILGDLLLQKNKQKLLIQIYQYKNNNISIEEMVGVLLWQLKSLLLSHIYTEQESGLKSFVFKKCKRAKWSQDEVVDLYKKMVREYHRSRMGGLDLFTRIELLLIEL